MIVVLDTTIDNGRSATQLQLSAVGCFYFKFDETPSKEKLPLLPGMGIAEF